jgi:hypothetical protein
MMPWPVVRDDQRDKDGVEMAEKCLLFLHGIEDDDLGRSWLESLESALRRDGSESLAERGHKVIAPSYLSLLQADEPKQTAEPVYTYRRTSPEEETASEDRYWLNVSGLERALAGVVRPPSSPLAGIPADRLSLLLIRHVAKQADRYRTSAARRHAIYSRVISQLPPQCDLVIVAHSLGSVVAADLLYHLPPSVRVELMITIGSPLSMRVLRGHVKRLRESFPFPVVGAWLNVIGHHDLVTASRGIASVFPEALDVFVNNGADSDAHSAGRYLEQEVVVRALNWVTREVGSELRSADQPLSEALLALAVGFQYALRLEQAQGRSERRSRFGAARSLLADEVSATLRESGETHPILDRLLLDNTEAIRGRVSRKGVPPMLLSAWAGNPIRPYEIKLDDKLRLKALANVASDLAVPTSWATNVANAMSEAQDAHDEFDWRKTAMVVVGIAAVGVAPALVLAFAPAGLAGGAALVGGLAALGPGGMLGGLTMVGVVGGVGGTVAASALASGSSQEVQQNIIFLQALALSRSRLQLSISGYLEWFVLVEMESRLSAERARLGRVSDTGAVTLKELDEKLKHVGKAIAWMRDRQIGPAELTVT